MLFVHVIYLINEYKIYTEIRMLIVCMREIQKKIQGFQSSASHGMFSHRQRHCCVVVTKKKTMDLFYL